MRSTAIALAVASAMAWPALTPRTAAAYSLQQCTPGPTNTTGSLPIGVLGDDGYLYRATLYGLVAGTTANDVSYPTGWLDPDEPYFARAGSTTYGLYDYVRATMTLTNPHQGNAVVNDPTFWSQCVNHWNASGLTLTDEDKQALEQHWMLYALEGQDIGADVIQLFHHAPGVYTLAGIEDKVNCEARVPITKLYSYMWWQARWPFPGNAASSPAIRDPLARRIAVSLAVGLIELDWHLWNGQYVSGQLPLPGNTFVHPPLTMFGAYQSPNGPMDSAVVADYVVNAARQFEYLHTLSPRPPWLTQAVDDAFAEGIARATERLAQMRLVAPQMNRYLQAAQASGAAKRALAGTAHAALASAVHDHVIDSVLASFNPLGYFPDDDGGWDLAYNQNNLNHMVNLLLSDAGTGSRPARVAAAAHDIDELEAHLVFTDRTSRHFTPSAMSTRTGGGLNVWWQTAASDYALPRLGGAELLSFGQSVLPFAHARTRDLTDMSPYQPNPYSLTASIDGRTTNGNFYPELICNRHPNNDTWSMTPLTNQTSTGLDVHVWSYRRPEYALEHHTVTTSGGSILRRHVDTIANQPSSRWLPFEMQGPYLRSFSDQYVFAKFGGEGVYFEGLPGIRTYDEYVAGGAKDFAAAFHIGPVPAADNRGFGGGQLAAVWAPGGGLFSLNRRKGYNNPPTVDSWMNDEWIGLPIHAVSIIDPQERWSSSARIDTPASSAQFVVGNPANLGTSFLNLGPAALTGVPTVAPAAAGSAYLEVRGRFSDERVALVDDTFSSAPMNVDYRRRFAVGDDGIRVRTDLNPVPVASTSRTTDERPKGEVEIPVLQAWETIPLWFEAGPTATGSVATTVTLIDTHGVAILASADPGWQSYRDIKQVIVTRERGTMTISFDNPQQVGLSPLWQGPMASRNLLVDLTPNHVSLANAQNPPGQVDLLGSVTVRYHIQLQSW